ncbi:siderophore ABC transporter substrate-binding protein [Vibrio sp. SCSIO 43136]|uniref:siderophore ABC transporter substrate-binding protein n=1 Tax=Vibrio sp. SCSIO 43136 TaxID=2819101 RepID=UPI00256EDE18|nr:siderophore ABC transporter substrate-binding protein [Vibrio sp. SCSIO 43136]
MARLISLITLPLILISTAVAKPISVKHNLGTTQVETKPERVIVIGVGPLDAIDSLGVKPVAVGGKAYFPEYLSEYKGNQYPSVGSLFEPDFEKIYSLKPDLIIVGVRASSSYKDLSEIAPTLVLEPDPKGSYWQTTQAMWRSLGKVFEKQQEVEKWIASFDGQIKALSVHIQKQNLDALTLISSAGNVSAFGKNSRFSTIYNDFGFKETVEGLKESRHGDIISYEFIKEKNPQAMLVIDRDFLLSKGKESSKSSFDNDLVKQTDAYKNNRIQFLNISAWYLAAGGVRAVETMISDVKQVVVYQ